MKPVRLEMTAFGPFAKTEVVDFRPAVSAGLFGIYGPTGAGKSSIFTAMTFALFGESAKRGQDSRALRSDHAHRATMTRVFFIFELGAKRYVILRTPEQARPKIHGDGETKQGHEASLFDASDIAVDDITPENCGRVIAEKKVGVVNSAVQDLLGYGPVQFRQIVLLPQGEFEKFLVSGTSERIAILRQLFDVTRYRKLEEWFKDAAHKADGVIREASTKYIGRLEGEGFDSVTALADGIAAADTILNDATKIEAQAQVHQADTAKALQAATDLNAAFDAQIGAQARLVELIAQEGEIANVRAALRDAQQAAGLRDIAAQRARVKQDLLEAQAEEKRTRTTAQEAQSQSDQAAARLAALQHDAPQIEGLKQKRADLTRHQQTLQKSQGQLRAVQDAQTARKQADHAVTVTKDRLATLTTDLAAAHARREAVRETAQTRADLTVRKAQADAMLTNARAYAKAQTNATKAQEAVTASREKDDAARTVLQSAEVEFAVAEANLAQVQAIHLAEKLQANAPCPVCGGTDHPQPATGDAEGRGLTEAFRQKQATLQDAARQMQSAAHDYSVAQALAQDRAAQLKALTTPALNLESCQQAVTDVDAALAALPDDADAAKLGSQIDALTVQKADLDTQIETAARTAQEAITALAVAQQSYDDAIATIPEQLRSGDALAHDIAGVTDDIIRRETALSDAHAAAQTDRDAAISAAKDAQAAQATLAKCEAEEATTAQHFADRLAQAGLTPESYAKHAQQVDQIPHFEKVIETYHADIAVAKANKASADEKIGGHERPDLTAAQATQDAAAQATQAATETKGEARKARDHLLQLQASIADEIARISALEDETAPLRELATRFNGQVEPRLTLETFAIQAMFAQVLEAANLRLAPMSSGRYRLEIQDENLKGAAKRGLGIQVFDLWTGKPRGTADISGGETFIAALALALGLSDVVERNAGSIRLDTIFIDEGFGSLDGEDGSGTLDQVLETLTQTAGQARAVGLISHVSMVKEAIPNGFQIEKTPRGSHIRVRDENDVS
ncbi:SMC family ATPase [Yoonia sp. 208BN28-4]|uniref:SMC family ATPase n=1 Tax=Yoonia sp. 208BN28-4 TaxID=3126505 RepID=UPI0030A9CA7D